MSVLFTNDVLVAIALGVIGAIVFSLIGLVSGTDETATIAPLTLLVILLGAPPAAVFTFFLAGAVAKHMTHAVPTTLLGIPGDTMAVPLMREARSAQPRGSAHRSAQGDLGRDHLRVHRRPRGGAVRHPARTGGGHGPIGGTVVVPRRRRRDRLHVAGKWSGVAALVPFVVLILALKSLTKSYDVSLNISYFLGIAVGPLIADLFLVLGGSGAPTWPQGTGDGVARPGDQGVEGLLPQPVPDARRQADGPGRGDCDRFERHLRLQPGRDDRAHG